MPRILIVMAMVFVFLAPSARAQWVARDERWQPRGPWNWAVMNELPELFVEFNGIDFGHAHLAETLLKTQDRDELERARTQVLEFIFSAPSVPPDEDIVGPRFSRMVWELRRTFNWTHTFHRALYDLFAADNVTDKDAVYRTLLADYLAKPEAITPHMLDHEGKLMTFPESGTFRKKFPKFNVQIWSYHWLQGAVYDGQLMGNAKRQRQLMAGLIEHYHGYLRNPPLEWKSMPMIAETSPEFSKRFPEASAIFDNLHMLHDNVDDVLSRPDLYPTAQAQREEILTILNIYLNRNHRDGEDRYTEFHMKMDHSGSEMDGRMEGMAGMSGMTSMKPDGTSRKPDRPPSAKEVLQKAGLIATENAGTTRASEENRSRNSGPTDTPSKAPHGHGGH